MYICATCPCVHMWIHLSFFFQLDVFFIYISNAIPKFPCMFPQPFPLPTHSHVVGLAFPCSRASIIMGTERSGWAWKPERGLIMALSLQFSLFQETNILSINEVCKWRGNISISQNCLWKFYCGYRSFFGSIFRRTIKARYV